MNTEQQVPDRVEQAAREEWTKLYGDNQVDVPKQWWQHYLEGFKQAHKLYSSGGWSDVQVAEISVVKDQVTALCNKEGLDKWDAGWVVKNSKSVEDAQKLIQYVKKNDSRY